MKEQQMSYWDTWHAQAVARNIAEDLADLGRQLLRDHAQHGLDSALDLGTEKDMPFMLELAAQAPATAFVRFMGDIASRNGADGELVARELLSKKLGSMDAADKALAEEESTSKRIWQEFSPEDN